MECKVIPFHTVEERSKTDADKAEALLSQAIEGFHKNYTVLYIKDITDLVSLKSRYEIDSL